MTVTVTALPRFPREDAPHVGQQPRGSAAPPQPSPSCPGPAGAPRGPAAHHRLGGRWGGTAEPGAEGGSGRGHSPTAGGAMGSVRRAGVGQRRRFGPARGGEETRRGGGGGGGGPGPALRGGFSTGGVPREDRPSGPHPAGPIGVGPLRAVLPRGNSPPRGIPLPAPWDVPAVPSAVGIRPPSPRGGPVHHPPGRVPAVFSSLSTATSHIPPRGAGFAPTGAVGPRVGHRTKGAVQTLSRHHACARSGL